MGANYTGIILGRRAGKPGKAEAGSNYGLSQGKVRPRGTRV